MVLFIGMIIIFTAHCSHDSQVAVRRTQRMQSNHKRDICMPITKKSTNDRYDKHPLLIKVPCSKNIGKPLLGKAAKVLAKRFIF